MTNSANEKMRALAQQLIADQSAVAPADKNMPAAFRACEKLRRPLTTLVGADGFQSLLMRALTLARRDAPGLGAVRINANGSLEIDGGNGPHLANYDADAGVQLVAQLLGLLIIFVGEDIPLRLLQAIEPNASSNTMRKGRDQEA